MTTDSVPAINIASVTITPLASSVTVGSRIPLQAHIQDPGGQVVDGTDIFWSAQDTSIATVSSDGIVTGVSPGSTQISANANGKSGIATVTVQKTPVASVVISPPHVDATPGIRIQLSAVTYDAAQNPLDGRVVSWSTSNAGVATVDGSGMTSAVSAGTATITATSEGKSGTATIAVSQAAVATVAVTPNPLVMSVGQTTQLSATLEDATGNVLSGRVVAWSTSNSAAATVSPQGLVTAVAKGVATITATSEGKSGTADVTTMNVAVGSVSVQPQNPSLTLRSSGQLAAIVRDVNGNVVTDRVVTWSTSNATFVGVSSSGLITGIALGSATITATSEGKSGTTIVTVVPAPASVSVVVVQPARDTMLPSTTFQLSAVTKDSAGNVLTGRTVAWTTSNPSVATVSSAGLVSATSVGGAATITATSEGKNGTSTITVITPIATITVSPATKTVLAGDTAPFTATAKDASGNVLAGRALTWSSSNAAVASVSSTGTATGTGVGTATITATAPLEGKSGSATLTVNPASVIVTPSPDSSYIGQTATLTATAKDKNGNAVPAQGFIWSSSASGVAAVTQGGVVSGIAAGSSNIVATLAGQSGQSTFKVLAPVATVTLSPSNPSLGKNDSVVLQAALKDATNAAIGPGRVVTWTTSDTSVVTVTPAAGAYSATVRARKAGTATITATSEGKSGTVTVTVKS